MCSLVRRLLLYPLSLFFSLLIANGFRSCRYFLREMVGVIKLKKYREMKKRYGQEEKKFDDIVRVSRGLEEEWRGKGDG